MADLKPGGKAYIRDPDEYDANPETTVYGTNSEGETTVVEVVTSDGQTSTVRFKGGWMDGSERVVATGRLVPIDQ